jgi:hypothetical protein
MEDFSLAQVLLIGDNNQICHFAVHVVHQGKKMKVHACLKTALALIAFSATSAMAEPLSMQYSGVPFYLNNNSYQGSFDGSFLPKKFIVNSLQFSFTFVDDGDVIPYATSPSISSTPVVERVSTGTRTWKETVTTTITMPRNGVGEKESVGLSFGALSFSGATREEFSDVIAKTGSYTAPSQVVYVKNNENVSCTQAQWLKGTANCQQVTRTNVTNYQNRIVTTDYTGEILLTGSLMGDSNLLASLLRDRKLDFSLGVLGDLNLVGGTLDIDFTPIEDASVVPEPASVSLFGIAMLGLAGIRRKRRA